MSKDTITASTTSPHERDSGQISTYINALDTARGKLNAYVISRIQDTARRNQFFANVPSCIAPVKFVQAVDGGAPDFCPANFPMLYRGHWRGSKVVKKGRFAIALSHLKVWKDFLESDAQHAVIFEDDAVVSPAICDALQKWPADCGLYFLNHRIDTWTYGLPNGRLSPVVDPKQSAIKWLLKRILGRPVDTRRQEEARSRRPVYVETAVRNVIQKKYKAGKDVSFPGSEGYCLTREGAAKLIDFRCKVGAVIGTDFTIIAASISQSDLAGSGPESDGALRYVMSMCRDKPVVRAAISGRPCVYPMSKNTGGSVKRSIDHSEPNVSS